MNAPTVWLEPARGGWRLCGTGRVPGSTWRSTHLWLTRGEALAALAAATEPVGTAGAGVLAVPTATTPVLAMSRAQPALAAGHEPGQVKQNEWTRPAALTTDRD